MTTDGPDMSWVDYLPTSELVEMERDLAGCATDEQREQALYEWRATAMVWADPALRETLTADITDDDLVDAPRPAEPSGD